MKEKISVIAVVVNIVLTVAKLFAGYFSGSALIIAEGFHSLGDIFSSSVALAGIKVSARPSDSKHPYGYYKYEVLSGLVITLILMIAGVTAVYEAYKGFMNPEVVVFSALPYAVMIFSAVVNEVMARVKILYGKKENSISLVSDGIHSRVDVYASLGALAGLAVTGYWIYADSLFALLVGFYIIRESFELGKEATDSLLDVSAGEEIESEIRKIIIQENIEAGSIKTQKKGSATMANLEIKLSGNLSVEEASSISEKLRKKLIDKIESLNYVAIQIKSHDLESSYLKTGVGGAISWGRKGRHRDDYESASGKGPDGACLCPKCGYSIPHERGVPCSTLKCPKCEVNLERK